MSQAEVEQAASRMYEAVNKLWTDRRSEIFNGSCGFSILSGPPIFRPSLMIIGGNPGFRADDCKPHIEQSWDMNSYILSPSAKWELARKLRSIFDLAGQLKLLEGAVQTNFLFYKSSSVDKPSRYRWNSLPASLRGEVEHFCYDLLAAFVRVSQPQAVLVLGIGSFDKWATNTRSILKARKQRLLVEGRVFVHERGFSVPAFGIIHPTGSRGVTTDDFVRAVRCIGDALAAPMTA